MSASLSDSANRRALQPRDRPFEVELTNRPRLVTDSLPIRGRAEYVALIDDLFANACFDARRASGAGGQHIGRPTALDKSKAALAQRMQAGGESASTIATALGVSRATVYRVVADHNGRED
jgi:transcriptional regulator of acetoin/glycerol metabolism